MDPTLTNAGSADYSGLKAELEKIAGIIEQYPDHLKQRAFELLIAAYMNSSQAKTGSSAVSPEAQPTESVPEEVVASEVVETAAEFIAEEQAVDSAPMETIASEVSETVSENDFSIRSEVADTSGLEPDSRINANIKTSTDMLRRRIRLRSMSQMPWRTTN